MNGVEMNKSEAAYNRRHAYTDNGIFDRPRSAGKPFGSRHITHSRGTASSGDNTFDNFKKKLCDDEFINSTVTKAAEWLEVDDPAKRIEGEKKKFPTAFLTVITIFAISLMLIIAGSVLTSKASMELYAAQNRLDELRCEQTQLEHELELKNDLRYIESEARNRLGMVDREHADIRYINNGIQDNVEIVEDKSERGFFAELLDALGFIK